MKSICLLLFFSFLVVTSCKKNENKDDDNKNDLEKLIKQSGDDSLIAQIVHIEPDGHIKYIETLIYNAQNNVETRTGKFSDKYIDLYGALSSNIQFIYKAPHNLIIRNITLSNGDIEVDSFYLLNNKVVEQIVTQNTSDTKIQMQFLYDDSMLRYEIWNSEGSIDSYKYEGNNNWSKIIATNSKNTTKQEFVFSYDDTKRSIIGDTYYMYNLSRFGNVRIAPHHNWNLCLNDISGPGLPGTGECVYTYDIKGRISGYKFTNGFSIKYIYR